MWKSTSELGYSETSRHRADAATEKILRRWRGARPKFDFHRLFHGCGPDVVDKILQQGFNRSFCGKNATFYGKGVYFARDASITVWKSTSELG